MTSLKICNNSLIPETFKLQIECIGNQQILRTWGIFSISARGNRQKQLCVEMQCVPSEGEQPESACEGDHSLFCISLRRQKCLPCCVHTQYLRTNCHSEGFRVRFNLQRSNISNLWLAELCSNKSGDIQAKRRASEQCV